MSGFGSTGQPGRATANASRMRASTDISSPSSVPLPSSASAQFYSPPGAKPIPVKTRAGKAPAMDVARYLIYLASSEPEPDHLSHLRLQKLLYYVQGWSLAMRSKPMFEERIEAWAHGPVVRDVYANLASYGDRSILPDNVGPPERLTEEEMIFIQSVWEEYKKFSASSLRQMTHQEKPWLDARQGLSPIDRCEKEITKESMQTFFTKLAH
jgi:uncharacterized phage-associated protein